MSEEKLKAYNQVGESLKDLRRPREGMYKELGRHFNPLRSRFDTSNKQKTDISSTILNSRPRLSHRTLQSGMHTGITSPARPWFRMVPQDQELKKYAPVKEHFAAAQREMRQMFQKSGMYVMLHTMWGDLGLYGYDASIIEEDGDALYGQSLVPGEYWLGGNARGMVDTTYREIEFTVKQIVGKFVYKGDPSNTPDWSVVSDAVKRMWDQNKISSAVPTRHLITPRYDRDARSGLAADKPIMSTYWEDGESKKLLGDLGYDDNPINASRWDVEGTATYGSSPAMDALGDARELQRKERDKAEAIRRQNRPPMNAPVEMRNSPYSLMPEAVNFMADPTKGMVPAYQVQPRVDQLLADIDTSEGRVDEAMYANLFLMIANLDRREITAREIDERHEEKLLGLGPVLERQHREKLAPLIRRGYRKVVESGRVPPLPEEFDGLPVEIDYISTLAQAQKAVATGGLERLYGFVGNISAVDGSVVDKLDNDVAVDEYADMIGVSTNVVRSENDVEEIRKGRQQQMEQQKAVEQAGQVADVAAKGADAARVLSEADGGAGAGSAGILADLGLTRG